MERRVGPVSTGRDSEGYIQASKIVSKQTNQGSTAQHGSGPCYINFGAYDMMLPEKAPVR
jgi:hypothetical protein